MTLHVTAMFFFGFFFEGHLSVIAPLLRPLTLIFCISGLDSRSQGVSSFSLFSHVELPAYEVLLRLASGYNTCHILLAGTFLFPLIFQAVASLLFFSFNNWVLGNVNWNINTENVKAGRKILAFIQCEWTMGHPIKLSCAQPTKALLLILR